MVLTTLLVTFAVTVGLAVVVLLTVAAPSLRRRGSRTMARIDAGAARLVPVLRQHRDRLVHEVRTQVAARLEAQRRGERDEHRAARAR
ncbi:hypothetical protein AB2L27_03905 [Kineococcus sp. LSe6-4]|uniref:Uncharacterized protein n=1 Tax=Kineococcus halophytocola TaxID=3234027 RepID=A0ABV4H0A1_9ACTN